MWHRPDNKLDGQSLLQRYGALMVRNGHQVQAGQALSQSLRLRRIDALMRNVVESSFDGIITFDEHGKIETANQAALTAFGYRSDDLLARRLFDIIPEIGGGPQILAGVMQVRSGHHELTGRRKDGSDFPLEMTVGETRNEGARLFVAIIRDITDRKQQDEQLQHQALHDALTGLPNRVLLSDRLGLALDVSLRTSEPMALLLIDLDRFKEVNDTLGHHIGDLVLVEVAQRLSKAVRSTDTIARLGGDEFAVLLPAVTDLERAVRVTDRITKGVGERLEVLDGIELDIACSIGIALFPDHASEAHKLMQCADVAMYTAKSGQLGKAIYDKGKDNHSVRHLTLTGELRNAIESGGLTLYYQPKIDLASKRLTSVEALARWIHPQHGAVPPDEFIVHAERTGLIGRLTRWTMETVLDRVAVWSEDGLEISVAVNLSARSLHDETLPGLFASMARDRGVETGRVILEITESAIMVDPDRALAVVSSLADRGFQLSIDDFGTGYSSLSYLRRLPVQELKIDQSFVAHMHEAEGDLMIVRSTIDLAHNLGLTVVAEGIEQVEHLDLLTELGCDVGQGYLIGKPLDVDAFADWLATSQWGPGGAATAAAE